MTSVQDTKVAMLVADPRFDLGPAAAAARCVVEGGAVVGVVVGHDEAAVAAAGAAGVDRIVVLDGPAFASPLPEAAAEALSEACDRHSVELLVLPAAPPWREVAALVTARADGACATDVIELRRDQDGGLLADRLLYGGVVIATVALQRRLALATMALPPVSPDAVSPGGESPPVTVEDVEVAPSGKELVERQPIEQEADLSAARRIVSVGRGLKARDDLPMIESLAAALEAELGCSRPVNEDLQWLPPERQVGLTGTTVKPELYLARSA